MEKSRDQVQKKPLRLIAAACNGMGIGKDGKVPWCLPREFQYFLDSITRVSRPGKLNLLIWGKVCWFSNPELFPLSNVLHVVVSTKLTTTPDHAHFVTSDFESAVNLASERPLADLIETVWVIGGRQMYEEGMKHPWCDLVYLTDIMADFDCDVFFPELDRKLFVLQNRFPDVACDIQEENGIKYKFQVFKKEVDNV
ncbi:dihydrofolate reductase [Cynoglossus semilaevis]|uniref:dihydrofolate reductase n=1 Tax=Cynoglossus semilaevis TaxID=244447 RepID=A0A3P8VJT5_CYNSE|nr:dihydrofolate reductase-like [Cynoglossus semilaevis]